MNERHSGRFGDNDPSDPRDVEAAFSEIVSGFEPEWVRQFSEDLDSSRETSSSPLEETVSSKPSDNWRSSPQPWEDTVLGQGPASNDEHYSPPEPPALPRPSTVTVLLILLVLCGLFLLIAPGLVGLSGDLGLTLGITGISLGLILLLLRVKASPSGDADSSDGAQV
jgi:hypothetical protein